MVSGIGGRFFLSPTAMIIAIGFMPENGNLFVTVSRSTIPKLIVCMRDEQKKAKRKRSDENDYRQNSSKTQNIFYENSISWLWYVASLVFAT